MRERVGGRCDYTWAHEGKAERLVCLNTQGVWDLGEKIMSFYVLQANFEQFSKRHHTFARLSRYGEELNVCGACFCRLVLLYSDDCP